MNKLQLKKFINSLKNSNQKQLVIRIHTKDFSKSLNKSRQIIEEIERNVRIEKLELAIRKLNLNRSWV
jgi:hypothetical protein